MAENETTTRFRVDISELRAEFQKAQRIIRTANSEFKAATAGMDDWSKSSDGLNAKIKQLNTVLDGEKSKLENLKNQYELTCAAQGEGSKGAEELKIKINNQRAAVEKTQKQLDSYKAALENAEKGNDDLQSAIKEQETELKKLKDEYVKTATSQGDSGDKAEELKGKIEGLSEELKENKTKLQEVKDKADEFDKSLEDVGDESDSTSGKADVFRVALGNLIADGISKTIGKLKELSKQMVSVGSGFEVSMAQVAATMGIDKSSEEYQKLESAAEKMGETTKYTAAESAEALNYLALAGYDADKAIEVLPSILTLAQAGGMDLATTSDMVTDAMGQMQIGTDELSNFINQMAKTSQKSNTNVQQLGEALLTVGGTSVTTGQDLTKTNTALGILANNGIKGAEGGTELRNILLSLTAPTDKAAEKLKQLGIDVADSNGNIRDIDDIMGDLNKTLSTMSEEEKTKALKTIFNKNDIKGVSALLGAAKGDFNKLQSAIEKSDGAAQKMADTMNDTLEGRMTSVKSAAEGVGIAVYKKLQTPLKEMSEKGAEYLRKLSDAIKNGKFTDFFDKIKVGFEKTLEKGEKAVSWTVKNADKVIKIAKTVAGAIAAIFVINKIATFTNSLKTMIGVVKLTQGAFTALSTSNPLGWIALGIGAAAALWKALDLLIGQSDDIDYSKMTDEQQKIIDKCNDVKDAFDGWKDSRDKIIQDTTAEYGYYEGLWDELKNITDEQGKIKNGYEDRAAFITNELANATGQEISIVDGTIQKYEELSAAIEDVLKKQEAEALQSSLTGSYSEAITKKDESLQAYRDAQKNVKGQEKVVDKLKKKAEAANKEYEKLNKSGASNTKLEWARYNVLIAESNLTEAKNKLEEFKSAADEMRKSYTEQLTTITNYENLSSALISGNSQKIETAMKNTTKNFITAETAVKMGSAKVLQEQKQELVKQWTQLQNDLKNGVDGVTQETVDECEALVDQASNELERFPDLALRVGINGANNFGQGIDGGVDYVSMAGQKMASAALQNVDTPAMRYKAFQAGQFLTQGFANGISNAVASVAAAAANAATVGMNALNSTLEIHSPSKKTYRTGEYFVLGFKNAIIDGAKAVAVSVGKMTQGALDALQNDISIDTHGIAAISVDTVGMAAMTSIPANSVNNTKNVNYNYTQNNYSPKSLSEREIYRQTKNLVATIRG